MSSTSTSSSGFIADEDKENTNDMNRNENVLIPSVPPVSIVHDLFPTMPTESILDASIPVNLPAPITPRAVKRNVPLLIPICDCHSTPKQYKSTKPTKTAQFMQKSLHKFKCFGSRTIAPDFDDSADSFGRLIYSDSE